MSLVGRLEDLGLGEILQLLSLSGKTGLLSLREPGGRSAQIFLTQGSIVGVLASEGYGNLAELVAAESDLDPGFVEQLAAECSAARRSLAALLCEHSDFDTDRLDGLRRAAAEGIVLGLFRWPEGEFSFDMSEESAELDRRELRLGVGLNAQFLALEGTRQFDETNEQESLGAPPVEDDGDWSIQFDEGYCAPETAMPEGPSNGSARGTAMPEGPENGSARGTAVSHAPEGDFGAPKEPLGGPSLDGPVVAIDSDLAVLEWIKGCLEEHTAFVHIFQSLDLARDRFRHYLARGVNPVVVLSQYASVDGTGSWRDVVSRLRSQSAKLPMIFLDDPDHPDAFRGDPAFRGVIPRPSRHVLDDPNAAVGWEKWGIELIQLVCLEESLGFSETEAQPAPVGEDLERLRAVTATLCSPEARGRVLELVVAYASESFERVALFMVRDGELRGMAQRGLDTHDDASFRSLKIQLSANPHLEGACRDGRAGTQRLDPLIAATLGAEANGVAYCAPIYGGEQLAAVLFADNASGEPLPDPRTLEIVLHGANLALERALLELVLEQEN